MILTRIMIFMCIVYMAMIRPAFAGDPAQCRKVIFADIGWNEVTVATALATNILQGLNYQTEVNPLTPAATYPALASDKVDVFLGGWEPVFKNYHDLYGGESAIDILRTNLVGGKYSLATNNVGATRGIQTFADIAKHQTALRGKIYGVEPGNPGNIFLLDMIAGNEYKLGTFELIESSLPGMLTHLKRADILNYPVVFLAWEPEPGITQIKPNYLAGEKAVFGTLDVQTVTRAGYITECQNIGNFLKNFELTIPIANELIGKITTENMSPKTAARDWLKRNPETVALWLNGMTTADGNDPKSALRDYLDK